MLKHYTTPLAATTVFGEGSLGTPSLKKWLFITISPPAKAKIECWRNQKTLKCSYDSLRQHIQVAFLDKFFKSVYGNHVTDYIYRFEHNKAGNVHLHALAFNDDIQTQYDMDCFRRTINTHFTTIKYLKNPKHSVNFNHIVYADCVDDQLEYIDKDYSQSSERYHTRYGLNH